MPQEAGVAAKVLLTGAVIFNTQYFADPKEQLIGIIMKQTGRVKKDPTGWQFVQVIEQAIDD